MRRWFAVLALLAACGSDRLPDFATGEPQYGYDFDASRPLDAGVDASPDAATDATLADR